MDPALTAGLGLVLGFLIGLTGVGGGALVAPALYVILGMTYTDSVGMSLMFSIFTKIVGSAQHLRQGNVEWRMAALYGVAAIPGAVIGSRLLYAAAGAERLFAVLMAAVLIVVAALLLLEANLSRLALRPRPFHPERVSPKGIALIALFSFCVGVLLGSTSVGSGSLIILSMIFLFQMSARLVVGTNIVIALIMVIPAGLTHFVSGGVDWRLLLLLVGGSAVGTVLGSRATMVVPERGLKTAIALLIVASSVATILRAW